MHNQEIKRLEENCKSEYGKVSSLKKIWDEALTQRFPLDFQGYRVSNKEQLNDLIKPRYGTLNENYKLAKKILANAKREKRNAEIVYKWINGRITFGLVFVAFVLGCFALCYDSAAVDRIWPATNSEQYILLNINNLDTKCLLHTNSLATLSAEDLLSKK